MLSRLTAPELIDTVVLHVIRRLEQTGYVAPQMASLAVTRLVEVPIARVTHKPLIRRIWALRHSITAYDAAYIALAEQLDVPLVTCDAKLARSNGHKAKIEVYPRT